MVIPRQPKMKLDRLPLLLLVICQVVPRLMMARKERNRLHLLLMQMSPVIHIVEMLSTKPPAQRRERGVNEIIAFWHRCCRSRDSRTFIDNGSGTAEGTTTSSSDINVTGNLCSGAAIGDGCGEAEATVLWSSVARWKERVVI